MTTEQISLTHTFFSGCDLKTTWDTLYSGDFDAYYLGNNQIGQTELLSEEPHETDDDTGQVVMFKRKVKIIPELGVLGGLVAIARRMYYAADEPEPIHYITTQCKAAVPDSQGHYVLSFENDVYKVESLRSPGLITLRPATDEEYQLYGEELRKSAASGDVDSCERLALFKKEHVCVMETEITVTTHFGGWMDLFGAHGIFISHVSSETDKVFRVMIDSIHPFLNRNQQATAATATTYAPSSGSGSDSDSINSSGGGGGGGGGGDGNKPFMMDVSDVVK